MIKLPFFNIFIPVLLVFSVVGHGGEMARFGYCNNGQPCDEFFFCDTFSRVCAPCQAVVSSHVEYFEHMCLCQSSDECPSNRYCTDGAWLTQLYKGGKNSTVCRSCESINYVESGFKDAWRCERGMYLVGQDAVDQKHNKLHESRVALRIYYEITIDDNSIPIDIEVTVNSKLSQFDVGNSNNSKNNLLNYHMYLSNADSKRSFLDRVTEKEMLRSLDYPYVRHYRSPSKNPGIGLAVFSLFSVDEDIVKFNPSRGGVIFELNVDVRKSLEDKLNAIEHSNSLDQNESQVYKIKSILERPDLFDGVVNSLVMISPENGVTLDVGDFIKTSPDGRFRFWDVVDSHDNENITIKRIGVKFSYQEPDREESMLAIDQPDSAFSKEYSAWILAFLLLLKHLTL